MCRLLTIVIAALVWVSGSARAAAAPTVAVAGDRPSAQQLSAELRTLGFEVVPAAVDPEPTPEQGLRRAGHERQVAAAVWIRRGSGSAEIWVLDRVTGKIVQRKLRLSRMSEEEASRTVAQRALELLRASFRELADGTVPPEATDRSDAPPEVTAFAEEPERSPLEISPRLFVHLGGGVAGAAGGLGPTGQVRVGLRYMPVLNFGLTLDGLIPTTPTELAEPEGSARISIGLLTVGAHFVLARQSWWVRPDLGVGVGAGFVGMKGEAAFPLEGRVDRVVTAVVQGRIGTSFLVHRVVHLRVDGTIGALLPEPTVRFAGRTVATWGQPFAVGLALVEFAIP